MLDDKLRVLIAQHGVGETRSGGLLLVDDERPNLIVLRGFLESGYRVHEAESGPQALEMARELDLDVVITDQRMPGMSGVEMLEQLRDIKPDVAGIVLTGFTDPPALISAINRARVFRFLRKPWQPDDILEAVRQASESVYQARAIKRLVGLLAQKTQDLDASLEQVRGAQRQLLHMERLGTMGRLASGVTHDLRNLMISLGFIESVLKEHAAEPELLETVHVGMHGVTNLITTLEALNSFARGDGLHMELGAVLPGAVISDAVAVARMDLAYRMHKVEVRVDADLPEVQGDRQKLTQVMVNLIRNALQATPQWRGVNIQAGRNTGGQVVFAVEDEGPGVPSSLREAIFQPFVSTKGDSGMGMGLYMARLIVESHNGQIAIVDRPEGGARFEVRIPPRLLTPERA